MYFPNPYIAVFTFEDIPVTLLLSPLPSKCVLFTFACPVRLGGWLWCLLASPKDCGGLVAQLEVLVAANSLAQGSTACIWVFGLTCLHLRRARTEFYEVQEFTEMVKKT